MPRYIDAEKFLKSTISKFKCVPLIGVPKCSNIEEYFDGEDLEQVLNQAPTEDVVPRSEVEHWKQEANRYQELWCKTYNDFEISELITEAKQDVASEIFEEIERKTQISLVNGHIDEACICVDYNFYTELKKKCIGE